jgi:PadR family transcriptional regulator PadR
MTTELSSRSGGVYTMPLLYPVIYRLEEQGFIEVSETVISEKNRTRNYYRITDEGRNHLESKKEEYQQFTAIANDFLGL